MAEEGNIGSRARRYARVGTAVGGLAVRLAGQRYFGFEIDQKEHAEDLKIALGGLKGPLMKVAQILSTVPDALPAEYAAQLAELQSNAPPMGWNFVKRRMASELGENWRHQFKEFEHEAVAAASLGQVHRATGHDGRLLACKLQYPDMKSVVEADLRQLKIVFAIYHRYDSAIDPTEIHRELSARLHEELLYTREARHMKLYARMLADESGVHIPDVIDKLSTERLLTMSWLDGVPLLSAVDRPLEERNAIAFNMFRAWYVPLYYYGVIHGDPHLGNYSVCDDGTINLLDFGCIRIFPAPFVEGVIDLYKALRDNDPELAVHAYETWGFVGLGKEVIDTLNLWAQFVYAPLLEDRKRKIQEGEGAYGARVAQKVHQELRRVGGVKPPPEFVLMDRAAIGLGSVFTHLKAEINWHRLFHDLIDNFDAKKLDARQKKVLMEFDLGPVA